MEMSNALSAYYLQKNDIGCNGITYTAVGTSGTPFTGTFDGGNYEISQLTISGSSGGNGLFGYVSGATIRNVRLVSGSVTDSGANVGSLIGHAGTGTTVDHSSSQMTVSAGSSAGGLIGYSVDSLIVTKSFYNGTMSATDLAGGLIGAIYGTSNIISNCYSVGSFTDLGNANIGGLIGYLYTSGSADVSNCYSAMSMSIAGSTNVGGLIGVDYTGTVSNSFAASAVSGSGVNHGGVFGAGYTTSTNVYLDSYITSGCIGAGTSTCTSVNSGNSTPNYFKSNNTNPPMSSWNFSDIWQIVSGGYPTLRGFISPVNEAPASSSSSSTPPSCGERAPTSAPDLFQVSAKGNTATLYFAPVTGPNNRYYISYGFDATAQGYGVEMTYADTSGAIPYTVNSLFPGTWYFKVRGGNGCMPGNWSKVMSVKIGGTSLGGYLPKSQTKVVSSIPALKCSTYTVKSGDSLWGIASRMLGSGKLFGQIKNSNDLSTTQLRVGQKLKVGC